MSLLALFLFSSSLLFPCCEGAVSEQKEVKNEKTQETTTPELTKTTAKGKIFFEKVQSGRRFCAAHKKTFKNCPKKADGRGGNKQTHPPHTHNSAKFGPKFIV